MCDLTDYLEANPRSKKLRAFTETEIQEMRDSKVPDEIIDFLNAEGLSNYKNNFYETTLPQWQTETLNFWGLKGKQCFAFLKTAFGGIFYFHKEKIYRLNPFTGNTVRSDFDFCNYLNVLMTIDEIANSCYYDIYEKNNSGEQLKPDEIYGLFPALQMGGSFETSKYEVVKMHEHLGFLAQLFDNKVKKI